MARWPGLAVPVVLAVLSSGCSRDLSVPAPAPPVLTLRLLSPNPGVGGQVITAEYEASGDVLTCEAILGPLFATCAVVPPRACRCTAIIPEDLTESVFAANLSATDVGGEGRLYAPFGVDQKAPKITASRVSFVQRAGSWTVSAQPAAIVDAISGTAVVRLFSAATGGAALAVLAPTVDGSIATTTLTGTPPAELWVEAEDRVGHVARVRAGSVDVIAGLAGRTRFTPTPVHLAPYFFDADWDPTSGWPGTGAVVAGEASAAAAAAAVADDSVVAITTAAAEPMNVTTAAWAPYPVPATPLADGRNRNGGAWQMAYDGARRRTVLFGGQYPPAPCFTTTGCAVEQVHPPETWEFDGETWTSLHVPGPPPRTNTSLAYDAARGRVVLFGGAQALSSGTTNRLRDTWEWDGQAWTSVSTPHAPTARGGHRLAYDPARGQLLLQGGNDGTSNCDGGLQTSCTGTWTYDGRDWRVLTNIGPMPVRTPSSMTWSAASGQVLLHGGNQNTGTLTYFGDYWVWDGSWTKLGAVQVNNVTGVTGAGCFDVARLRFQSIDPVTSLAFYEVSPSLQLVHGPDLYLLTPLLYDPVRRVTYANGDATTMWILDQRTPHARTAVHSFALDVAAGATLTSLSLTWVGAGSGAAGNGASLHAWNWTRRSWDLVGSHTASEGASSAARTIAGAPPGAASDYLDPTGTRIWLMASAPPSDLGSTQSRITTDFVQVHATYTLP